MKTKKCTKCKKDKLINNFRIIKSKKSDIFWICGSCKDCLNLKKTINNRLKYPEKYTIKNDKLCKICDKIKNKSEFRVKKNIIKNKSYLSINYCCKICEKLINRSNNFKQNLKTRSNLPDSLIKGVLINWHKINKEYITKELIEAKRQNILLKRKIKNNEQPQICN